MGLYSYKSEKIINESLLMSDEGNKLYKKLKSEIDSLRDDNLSSRYAKVKSGKYDEDIARKSINILNKNINIIYKTIIIKSTIYQNGVPISTNYKQQFTGFKNDNLYITILNYQPYYTYITMSEKKLSKTNIEKDIIEYAVKEMNKSDRLRISFGKDYIKYTNLLDEDKNTIKSILKNIDSYVTKKYPNKQTKIINLANTIKIK